MFSIFTFILKHVNCVFTEDLFKHLNVSSNEELSHLLKCLEEDMIQDDNFMSEEDVKKLCSGIDFGDEILQNDLHTNPAIFPEENIPFKSITLGDELNLTDIIDNPVNNILQSIENNSQVNTATFDIDLDELLNQPFDMSSQEVTYHMNNFLESDIAKEIEKVSNT